MPLSEELLDCPPPELPTVWFTLVPLRLSASRTCEAPMLLLSLLYSLGPLAFEPELSMFSPSPLPDRLAFALPLVSMLSMLDPSWFPFSVVFDTSIPKVEDISVTGLILPSTF